MASKTMLITGANRGIGFAIAQSLAQDPRLASPTIIIASRKLQDAEEAATQLRSLTRNSAAFESLALDVDDDTSISSAVAHLTSTHTHLDVLVNNAGVAYQSPSVREAFSVTLNTNVTSVAAVSTALLPLLRRAAAPRVINVSSGRGSLGLVSARANPPTQQVAYSVSKAALNLLTIELAHAHERGGTSGEDGLEGGSGGGGVGVEFQAVNPGSCKTGFNGWRGVKDPLEGARSTVELVVAARGTYKAPGFWEWVDGEMKEVQW